MVADGLQVVNRHLVGRRTEGPRDHKGFVGVIKLLETGMEKGPRQADIGSGFRSLAFLPHYMSEQP